MVDASSDFLFSKSFIPETELTLVDADTSVDACTLEELGANVEMSVSRL